VSGFERELKESVERGNPEIRNLGQLEDKFQGTPNHDSGENIEKGNRIGEGGKRRRGPRSLGLGRGKKPQ